MGSRPMTRQEQRQHEADVSRVIQSVELLGKVRAEDEDVQVAKARLENWLDENKGRWSITDTPQSQS